MNAISHDVRFIAPSQRLRLATLPSTWARNMGTGAMLVIVGAWAALVPFVGPYLHFAYTPATGTTWHWTTARGWFEVAPGAAIGLAGLILLFRSGRALESAASWLGAAGGAWLIVGQALGGVLNQSLGSPDPTSTTTVQALEALFFFYALGAIALALSAMAFGRASVLGVDTLVLAQPAPDIAATAPGQPAEVMTPEVTTPDMTAPAMTTPGVMAPGMATAGMTTPATTQGTGPHVAAHSSATTQWQRPDTEA